MDDTEFEDIANKALTRMREIVSQTASVHADMPYTILVALMAECALMADDPALWMSEFLAAVTECSMRKINMLVHESAMSTHH